MFAGNRFCARLLEAAPDESVSAVEDPSAHVLTRRFVMWSEANARGVVPRHVCDSRGGHIDLRGNNLVGSVPRCAWSPSGGASQLLMSRNMLTGTLGR